MSIFLAHVSNPFSLAQPTAGWLLTLEQFDADLRLFPSQKEPVFRLMRLARHSGALSGKLYAKKGVTDKMHPDTRIAIAERLVPVTALLPDALRMPPEQVVQYLKDRDISAHGGADAVCDRLEAQERADDQKIDDQNHDEGVQRHRAARIGYQYRTGARVSLVRPVRSHPVVAPILHTPAITETPGVVDASVSS